VIAYLDCTTGISGDKFLAALVDAGAPVGAVGAAVAAIDPSITVEFSEVTRSGIRGLAVSVRSETQPPTRTWDAIRELITNAELHDTVRETALAAFALLAEVEARVHGVSPAEVRFHEVGAIDSVADVVGTAAALHALGIDHLVCGPVATGTGTVDTVHGVLPVPAPATALLLEGVPVEAGPLPGEATTPTGAALLRACVAEFGPLPAMTLVATGHGAGSRDVPGVPNVARVLVGTAGKDAPSTGSTDDIVEEAVVEVETTVDHLSAEHLAFCCEEVRAAGALDVWQVPALMKKGRAGTVLTALSTPADAGRLAQRLARLTGSLGVRLRPMTRLVVPREERTVETSFGPVRAKVAGAPPSRRVRPEYEDVAAIARRTAVPIDLVARAVEAEVRAALESGPDDTSAT